jgi:enoyl-CoA hydratase
VELSHAGLLAAQEMLTYELLSGDVPIGRITMDDKKMNAVGFEAADKFMALLDVAEKDASRAIVIAGNQRAFSAGFDLSIMKPKATEESRRLLLLGTKLVMRL